MVGNRVLPGFILLCGSIVVSGYTSVNGSSVDQAEKVKKWADGSPMPLPQPKGSVLVSDGSPMPLPEPKKGMLLADGSPMPLPEPKNSILVADGSPMPLPEPKAAAGWEF